MQKHKIKVYSTKSCHYCTMEKDFLKQNKIEFEDVDVSDNQKAANEMVKKSGQMGVPVTEIDDEIVVGFDKEKLKKILSIK